MTLVAAKCTQCGANLKIDNTLEAAVCPHCKTPFITEKAINNYNTYNQSTYNIQHANLQVNDEKSIENRLKNAEVFLTKHKDYQKAMELFKEISEDAPDDYRTWWGIVRAGTKEFSAQLNVMIIGSKVDIYDHYGGCSDYYYRALQVAPENVKGQLTKTWQEYLEYLKPVILKELNRLKQGVESKLNDLNKKRTAKNNEIKSCQGKIDDKSHIRLLIFSILICALGIKWMFADSLLVLLGVITILLGGFLILVSIASFDDPKKAKGQMQGLMKDLNSIDSEISPLNSELQRYEALITETKNSNNRQKLNV